MVLWSNKFYYIPHNLEFDFLGDHLMNARGALVVGHHCFKEWLLYLVKKTARKGKRTTFKEIHFKVAAVSYFSSVELCSGRIVLLRERTGLGTTFIR